MATILDVAISVVDGDILDLEVLDLIDREALHRCIFDIQPLDGAICQVVGI